MICRVYSIDSNSEIMSNEQDSIFTLKFKFIERLSWNHFHTINTRQSINSAACSYYL